MCVFRCIFQVLHPKYSIPAQLSAMLGAGRQTHKYTCTTAAASEPRALFSTGESFGIAAGHKLLGMCAVRLQLQAPHHGWAAAAC